jgi:hypothetical protein
MFRKQIQFPKQRVFHLFRTPDNGQSPETNDSECLTSSSKNPFQFYYYKLASQPSKISFSTLPFNASPNNEHQLRCYEMTVPNVKVTLQAFMSCVWKVLTSDHSSHTSHPNWSLLRFPQSLHANAETTPEMWLPVHCSSTILFRGASRPDRKRILVCATSSPVWQL